MHIGPSALSEKIENQTPRKENEAEEIAIKVFIADLLFTEKNLTLNASQALSLFTLIPPYALLAQIEICYLFKNNTVEEKIKLLEKAGTLFATLIKLDTHQEFFPDFPIDSVVGQKNIIEASKTSLEIDSFIERYKTFIAKVKEDVHSPLIENALALFEGKVLEAYLNKKGNVPHALKQQKPYYEIKKYINFSLKKKGISTESIEEKAKPVADDLRNYHTYLFLNITQKELLTYSASKIDKESNLALLAASFQQICDHIRADILGAQSTRHQRNIIRFYYKVRKFALEHNDYHTAAAITAAFSHAYIEKMENVKRKVRHDLDNDKIALIQETLTKKKNCKAIREQMKSDIAENEKFIPYIPLYMQDLTFINDGNPKFVVADKNSEIIKVNVDKLRAFEEVYAIIYDIQKILSSDFSLTLATSYVMRITQELLTEDAVNDLYDAYRDKQKLTIPRLKENALAHSSSGTSENGSEGSSGSFTATTSRGSPKLPYSNRAQCKITDEMEKENVNSSSLKEKILTQSGNLKHFIITHLKSKKELTPTAGIEEKTEVLHASTRTIP